MTAAADLVTARGDKRPAVQSPSTELHAAFEAAAIHRPSPADRPGRLTDPATAAVAAADHALAQALAGLSPAAREAAIKQLAVLNSPQVDLKRSRPADETHPSPMHED
jgi:hypothetical protein